MLKSTKSLLIRLLGAQTWTLEELSTILCRVEAVLNFRPPVNSCYSRSKGLGLFDPRSFFNWSNIDVSSSGGTQYETSELTATLGASSTNVSNILA